MTHSGIARVLELRGRALWIAIAVAVTVLAIIAVGIAAAATSMQAGDDASSPSPSVSASPSLTEESSPTVPSPWVPDPSTSPSVGQEGEYVEYLEDEPDELGRDFFYVGSGQIMQSLWSPTSTHVALTTSESEVAGSDMLRIVDVQSRQEFVADGCGVFAAWSPAGDRLVNVNCSGGAREIRILDLNAEVTARHDVGTAKFVGSLAWSVDRNSIYFTRGASWHAYNSEIARLDLGTGQVTTVDQGGLLAVDVAQGKLAYWADPNGNGLANALYVANADGSNRVELVSEPSSELITQTSRPRWSPDGTALAYRLRLEGEAESWSVYEVSTGKSHSVLVKADPDSYGGFGQIVWSPDSSKLFISEGKSGWVVTRSGTLIGKASFSSSAYDLTAWSHDGASVSMHYAAAVGAQVWDIASNEVADYAPIDGFRSRTGPLWSPDGRAFVWVGVNTGTPSHPHALIVEEAPLSP